MRLWARGRRSNRSTRRVPCRGRRCSFLAPPPRSWRFLSPERRPFPQPGRWCWPPLLFWVRSRSAWHPAGATGPTAKAAEEECRAKIAESLAWQSQLTDSRRTEEVLARSLAEARAHLAELAGQRTLLQSELDSRKRVERTLSQQRQALESSKTVLEMHVEASTLELEKLQDRYEVILNSAG